MICLTGDIHHSSLNSPEQRYSDYSEAELASHYLKICKRYNIKATLFFTGRSFLDDWEHIRELMKFNNFEIGGHTFTALRPRLLHDYFRKLFHSYYGPSFYQWFDIKRTLSTIKRKTGITVVSWRTHAYSSDKITYKLLPRFGVRIITDEVKKNLYQPHLINANLFSFSINVLPDHEHIFHADRTVSHVERKVKAGWQDDFTQKSYQIEDWLELVKEQVKEIETTSGIATLLVHPLCMHVADNFQAFEKLCVFLSSYRCETLREALYKVL